MVIEIKQITMICAHGEANSTHKIIQFFISPIYGKFSLLDGRLPDLGSTEGFDQKPNRQFHSRTILLFLYLAQIDAVCIV